MLPQPTHLYQSEFISFFQIFPSLVFGTFPSAGAPRFYLGEGVVYQVFLTLISFLNLAPKPKASPPQFQGLWLLVTPSTAPHCIKPTGNNLLSSSSQILAACVSPTPTLLQSRQQPVASYLSGVTPSCHLLTAAAPAPPRQTQPPSWSSVVTLGLQHPEGISDAVHRPL